MARKRQCPGMCNNVTWKLYEEKKSVFTFDNFISGFWGMICLLLPMISIARGSKPSDSQGGSSSNSTQRARLKWDPTKVERNFLVAKHCTCICVNWESDEFCIMIKLEGNCWFSGGREGLEQDQYRHPSGSCQKHSASESLDLKRKIQT